jgi:hypothetical protein
MTLHFWMFIAIGLRVMIVAFRFGHVHVHRWLNLLEAIHDETRFLSLWLNPRSMQQF